ncbi:selenium cofactor biosynthesis protein YqeC [[Eubacterium] cellulosolvens]
MTEEIQNDSRISLAEALRTRRGDVIAFVGAGGKTSLMLALAEELYQHGNRVIVTTTTKLGTSEQPINGELVVESDEAELISKAHEVLSHNSIPVLTSRLDGKLERVHGIDPSVVECLANETDFTLIEADGARMKPFKVPKAHEPVVPGCVNKLCIVVGLDALGKEITEENFYNTEGMRKLGARLNEPLSVEQLRKLLTHSSGYLRFKAEGREIFLILNKIDKLVKPETLTDLTYHLFHDSISRIMVTSAITSPPVKLIADNNSHRIKGIILAAGESKRFNGIKQCVDIGGSTLLGHVLNQALSSLLDDVVLVLGHEKDEIIRALGNSIDNERLTIVENLDYKQGLSTSIKKGLTALQTQSDAVMIILGDQPRVTTEVLNKLLSAYRESNSKLTVPLIATSSGSRYGNPVTIGKDLFSELMQITGDIGAREVVSNHVSYARLVKFDDESTQFQINTQEDLKKYLGEANK